MPSQFFTVVNNQFTYTFNPLPGVTTYDFVVIGAGGGEDKEMVLGEMVQSSKQPLIIFHNL